MNSENTTSAMTQLCHLLIHVRRHWILDQLMRSQAQNHSHINDCQGQDYSQISGCQVGQDHGKINSVCQEVKSKQEGKVKTKCK